MNLRLANDNDLAKVKAMYRKIIDNMNSNNIGIWDEIYPCEFFKDDIDNNRLYLYVRHRLVNKKYLYYLYIVTLYY